MMNRKIFFSYSWKDMKMAMRLYDDLSRSHLTLWRDQIDGDPTSDFYEEFLSKIDECDDFLILDSVNYRTKSNWCIKEIERCYENRERRNAPRIIVCLLNEDGEWRTQYKDEHYKYYFSKINLIKYFPLFYKGTYDNENIYYQTLTSICSLFSKRYIQWNSLPSDRDLEEEISVSTVCLTDTDRTCIINLYEYICRQIELGKDVSDHFKLWIEDCRSYKLNLFFPTWTYCIWLGQDINNGKYYDKCYEEFQKLSKEFPEDPRVYRGLGCVSSRIGMYDIAKESLLKALTLLMNEENLWQKHQSQIEVLVNLGQVCINRGEYSEAVNYMFEAYDSLESNNGFDIKLVLNLVYCLLMVGDKNRCKGLLINLISNHPLEGELYAELGKMYSEENNHIIAYDCFYKAYLLCSSTENAFYKLCQKIHIDNHGIIEEAEEILKMESVCMDDNYWKGAICYYVINDVQRAYMYYSYCDTSLYNWYV